MILISAKAEEKRSSALTGTKIYRKEAGNVSNEKIAKILDAHFVPHFEKDGRIFADSMMAGTALFEEVEDCTNWSIAKMRSWLGY